MLLNITRTTHREKPKPKGAEIGKIQNEIKRNREELSPSELLHAITKEKRHYQATATRYEEETLSKPFESASLIVLDIDNEVSSASEQLDARTLITVLDSLNLHPLTVYKTDSHHLKHLSDGTPQEKLRVVFHLPEVVNNLNTFKTITNAIRETIINATQCSDKAIDNASETPAQLFYGTDRGSIIPEEVGAFILDDEAKNQPYESLEPLNHVRLVDVVYDYLAANNKTINKETSSDKARQQAKRLYDKTIEQLVSDLKPQEFKETIPKPEQIQHRDIPRDFLPYLKLLQAVERGVWIEGIEQTPENLHHAPVEGTRLRGDILWYIASSLDYIKGGLAWLREVMNYHIQTGTRDMNGNLVYEKRHLDITNYRKHRGKSGLPKYNPTTLKLISPYTSDHQYQNLLAVVPEGKKYRPPVIGDNPEIPPQRLKNASLNLSTHLNDIWDRLHQEDASGTPKTTPIISGIRIDTGAGKTRQLQEQIKTLIIKAYHYELGLSQSTPDFPVIAFSTHLLKNEFLEGLIDLIDNYQETQEYDDLQRKSPRIIKPELRLEDYILTTPEVPKPPEGIELPGNIRGLYEQLLRAYAVKHTEKPSEIREQLINTLKDYTDQTELREFRQALREYGTETRKIYSERNRYDKVVLTTHDKALETDKSGIYSLWNDPTSTRGRHLVFDEEPSKKSTTITPDTWSIFKSIFSDKEGTPTYGKAGIYAIEKWMNSDRTATTNPLHDREKYNAPDDWKTGVEQVTGKAWEAIQKQASDEALEQGTTNPLDILDAPFLVKDTHGTITGKATRTLPYLQYTVLSATMTRETLKTLFSENIRDDESNINYIDTPPVNLIGRIHQRTLEAPEHNLSHSKAAINRPETLERITEDLQNKDIGAIITTKETKKRYNEALGLEAPEVHYGNTLGSNELKGKNIAVVGDWNLPDHEIINLYLLENPDTETLDLRKGKVRVTWNNITVTMWTFKHEGLRYIHLREDEKQIMQAVGRARAIREDVDVYVYARIPLPTYWTSGKAQDDEQEEEAPSEVLQTYSSRDEPPPKSEQWKPWEQPNPPPPV